MHPESAYYTDPSDVPDPSDLTSIADRVFAQVFRHDFSAPGFALLGLGSAAGSSALRRFMVSLKELLDERYRQHSGLRLVYLSMGRFDQQETTKFHLDGAPEVSFLMLGYEPSEVRSKLAMADYSRAAFDRGIEPRRFLTEFNPMFSPGERVLAPYVTPITPFDPAASQVLLINNSSQPFTEGTANQLGVMHQATILSPDPQERRLVNSTMIVSARAAEDEPVSRSIQQLLVETEAVAGALKK